MMAARPRRHRSRKGAGPDDPLVVLESFGPPHGQTNPYSRQLFDSFPDSIRAEYFSWSRALRGDYDVFHLHWPEVKVRGATPLRSLLRGTAFVLVLLRIRLGGIALVRTLHDLRPHEPPTRLQAWVLRLCDRWTTVWITLNESTPIPTSAPVVLAPIGDFRHWFTSDDRVDTVPGRLLHFGLVRRYKGVDALLHAFSELSDPDLSLHIVGTIVDDELAEQIRRACVEDDRIEAADRYVDDDALRAEVLQSELVVLPFASITNSSSLVLALSLDRPVLAPSAASIEEVAAEVGGGWVRTYDGNLGADTIREALESLRGHPSSGRPDLSFRDWSRIGKLHAEAFELAAETVRPRWPGRSG